MARDSERPVVLDQYLAWLEVVPEPVRHDVADKIAEMPVRTYGDLAEAAKYLMVELLRGNIAPEVMQWSLKAMEFIAVAVAAQHSIEGTVGGGMHDVMAAVRAAKAQLPPLDAKYTTTTLLAPPVKAKRGGD